MSRLQVGSSPSRQQNHRYQRRHHCQSTSNIQTTLFQGGGRVDTRFQAPELANVSYYRYA